MGYQMATMMMGSNASFRAMQNSQPLKELAVGHGYNLAAVHNKENSLMLDNIQNSLVYKASGYMLDSSQQLLDRNIKRTFSTFA